MNPAAQAAHPTTSTRNALIDTGLGLEVQITALQKALADVKSRLRALSPGEYSTPRGSVLIVDAGRGVPAFTFMSAAATRSALPQPHDTLEQS
jgi:hypothetical protein